MEVVENLIWTWQSPWVWFGRSARVLFIMGYWRNILFIQYSSLGESSRVCDDDIIVIGNNDKEDDEILSWDWGDSLEARHFVSQQKYVIDL